MPKVRRGVSGIRAGDAVLPFKQRKPVPHEFVLDAIASLSPYTRPMCGCLAVYVEDRTVLILRDKGEKTADNGVWLATNEEHHESLRREFPNMRSIKVLGKPVTAGRCFRLMPQISRKRRCAFVNSCSRVILESAKCGERAAVL